MPKKKKLNPFLKLLALLFIVFIALFIASSSGYYESKIRDRVVVTEDGIKEFEEMVQKGEDIDISSFLKNEREDYSSNMSDLGDNITTSIEGAITNGMKFVGNVLKSLF